MKLGVFLSVFFVLFCFSAFSADCDPFQENEMLSYAMDVLNEKNIAYKHSKLKIYYEKYMNSSNRQVCKANGAIVNEIVKLNDWYIKPKTKAEYKQIYEDEIRMSKENGMGNLNESIIYNCEKSGKTKDECSVLLDKALGAEVKSAKERCGNSVDISEQIPPVRDQDTVGWCFSYVAADLASYKLKKRVSAIATAVEYYDYTNEEDIVKKNEKLKFSNKYSGRTNVVLNNLSSIGVCLEEDVPSNDLGIKDLSIKTSIGDIEDIVNKVNHLKAKRMVGGGYLDSYQRIDQLKKLCESGNCLWDSVKLRFPKLNDIEILEAIEKSNEKNIFSELVKKSCKNRINMSAFKPKYIDKKEELLEGVHTQLNKKNPVGVSFVINGISSPFENSEGRGHVVVVVGKHWDEKNQSCNLKIKNSWGSSCPRKQLDPLVPSFYHFMIQCNNGYFDIPDKMFIKHSFGASFYE